CGQGHIDDARANSGGLLRTEAQCREATGPISLEKNISVRQQDFQAVTVHFVAQIEVGRVFAASGIDDQVGQIRQVGTADGKDVSAMGGKGAAANGASNDTCQIQDADPG